MIENFGVGEYLIVVVIVLLALAARRIPEIARKLESGITALLRKF